MHVALLGFMSESGRSTNEYSFYSHRTDSFGNSTHRHTYSSSSYSRDYYFREDSVHEKIRSSFGTAYQAIVSMAYAMVGMFDPEVFFHCGDLKWCVVPLFVLYLVIQMIIMFNTLIAAMGDAFDGVRADEEESFLMARANFIDQNEASLTKKEIQTLKSEIGKYLYVLIPEDKQLEDNVSFWKGRIPTIKEDVRTIVQESQEQMIKNMNETNKGLKDDMNRMEERITKCLEERFMLMLHEQRITNDRAGTH